MQLFEFDRFLSIAFPGMVTFCGVTMTQVEALKRVSPTDYLNMFEEWLNQDAPPLRLVK